MSYQVLARKYRPQKFSEVIGQEHVTHTLKNAIEQGRTAHGYIFSGHRGHREDHSGADSGSWRLNCRSFRQALWPNRVGFATHVREIRAGNPPWMYRN